MMYMVDESGCLDHTCAVFVLNKMMKFVHALEQETPYIYIGA